MKSDCHNAEIRMAYINMSGQELSPIAVSRASAMVDVDIEKQPVCTKCNKKCQSTKGESERLL